MKFKIPKKTRIFSTEIKVIMEDKLEHETGCVGEANYNMGLIKIQNSTKERPVTKVALEQIYLHELIHWIFNQLNEHDLRKNEKLVDTMSMALHQALTDAEY